MATGVQVWSQTPATNATVDTNINWAEGMAPSQVNDSARAEMASVAKWRDDNNGTLVTSGSSTAFTVATNQVEGSLTAGYTITCQFHATAETSATLNVDSLGAKQIQYIPGSNLQGQEIQAQSIQRLTYQTSSTAWILQDWIKPIIQNSPITTLTKATTADITLSSTSAFTDGPSVAQGSSGVWYACGTVSVLSGGAADTPAIRLWDGTTIMDSAAISLNGGSLVGPVSLSGVITSPAGNIRISGRGTNRTDSKFVFNQSGDSKDSSIYVVRIG